MLVGHIQRSMHGETTNHVNPLGSLKSFIDLSEQLRQKYVGQAVLKHAARSLELPRDPREQLMLHFCMFAAQLNVFVFLTF